jgi:hypothetical protein
MLLSGNSSAAKGYGVRLRRLVAKRAVAAGLARRYLKHGVPMVFSALPAPQRNVTCPVPVPTPGRA